MELLYSLLQMLNQMSPYILLGFLMAGIMHAFIPQQTLARHLSGRGMAAVIKAALIGVPLPLCSCGVLPTAIAMRRAGASRAASTSFLIATPQTGVDSIAATASLLGPAFAFVRPLAALVTAVFGGLAVGYTEKDATNAEVSAASWADDRRPATFGGKCLAALRYGYIDMVASIGRWLVIGLVVAALITVYVPADSLAVFGSHPLLAMLAVVLVAIPMYVCATGSIPIALSLMLKGLSPGTAFVLLMAGPAANFASFTLISREMGRKPTLVYIASIVAGAMAFGLAIDYLLPSAWFVPASLSMADAACCHHFDLLPSLCSAILAALLVVAFIRNHTRQGDILSDTKKEYTIKGMQCSHCQATVARSISGVKGVNQVSVDLASGKATVDGNPDDADIAAAVRSAGFDIE